MRSAAQRVWHRTRPWVFSVATGLSPERHRGKGQGRGERRHASPFGERCRVRMMRIRKRRRKKPEGCKVKRGQPARRRADKNGSLQQVDDGALALASLGSGPLEPKPSGPGLRCTWTDCLLSLQIKAMSAARWGTQARWWVTELSWRRDGVITSSPAKQLRLCSRGALIAQHHPGEGVRRRWWPEG